LKKGKLNKIELSYIENNLDRDVADLAKDLDRTVSTIESHVNSLQSEQKAKPFDGIARSKDNNAAVMTETASSIMDDKLKITPRGHNPNHIFNPKD
jgi:DeoR/GlpR family transcriptional regulator of sugar metabolism